MNLFLHELRSNRKAIIIWCASIIVFIWMGVIEFSSTKGTNSMSELYNSLPDSLKALMGGGGFDVDKAIGYYAILFIYINLMVTIHAALLGAGIISKEERDKTAEFLMTRPISRGYALTNKLWATLLNLVIINLAATIASISMFGTVSDEPIIGDLFQLMLGMFFLQLFFSALGFMLSCVNKEAKIGSGITTGILLTAFFLSIVVDLNKSLNFIKYLTPFRFFDPKTLLIESGFRVFYIILTLGLTGLFIFIGYYFYQRRDLKL